MGFGDWGLGLVNFHFFIDPSLRPSYEPFVDTAADIIERDITPFLIPGADIWVRFFADSQNSNYQEISRRFLIAKDWDEYQDMVRKVVSTGLYGEIGTIPWCFEDCTEEFKDWYRSSERISGLYPYQIHLSNKKWPLKKVL